MSAINDFIDWLKTLDPTAADGVLQEITKPGSKGEAWIRGISSGASMGAGPALAREIYPGEAKAQASSLDINPLEYRGGQALGGAAQAIPAAKLAQGVKVFANPQLVQKALDYFKKPEGPVIKGDQMTKGWPETSKVRELLGQFAPKQETPWTPPVQPAILGKMNELPGGGGVAGEIPMSAWETAKMQSEGLTPVQSNLPGFSGQQTLATLNKIRADIEAKAAADLKGVMNPNQITLIKNQAAKDLEEVGLRIRDLLKSKTAEDRLLNDFGDQTPAIRPDKGYAWEAPDKQYMAPKRPEDVWADEWAMQKESLDKAELDKAALEKGPINMDPFQRPNLLEGEKLTPSNMRWVNRYKGKL